MTHIEAMKQALEALERIGMKDWVERKEQAITSLRQAIAEAEKQEPPPECQTEAEKTAFAFGWFKALESQPKREPLTDEQIEKIAKQNDVWRLFRSLAIFDFVRAIEAAHGIKGEA